MLVEAEHFRAFVFPGQGTQRAGMSEFLFRNQNPDVSKLVRRVYEEAGDILQTNLGSLCLSGPDEELDKPEITQPAILVTSIAALRALGYYDLKPDVVAGHSLGEFSSLVAAEALSFAQAVRLVNARGKFMESAGKINPGGMVAVLGLELPEVEEICEESGAEIANINSDTQIVISGRNDSISYIVDKLGDRKARRLRVSIASHSSLMEPARQNMELLLQRESIADPAVSFIQNITGDYALTGEQVRRGLVDQLTGRVLWLDSVRRMQMDGVGEYIEVGPGDVLTKIIKRIDPSALLRKSEIRLAELGALDI